MARNMESGYRQVLQLPGARRVFAAALLGRLSLASVSLALLLAVARNTGSYAVAGTAVGAFGLTNVLVAPARARFVDRAGPRVALPRLSAGYAGLVCALAGLTLAPGTGRIVLVVVAALAGLCPPTLGAAMRAYWASLTHGTALLAKAYSLDAVAEELLFVTGPLLVGLVVAVAPAAIALLGAAVVSLVGTLLMVRWTASAAPPARAQSVVVRTDQPLRQPGFPPLLVALIGVGVVLGTVEVAAPAFADHHGSRAATGSLLAALSIGSAVGGLLYGARTWRLALTARLFILLGALTALSAALLAARSVLLLAVLLVVLGLFVAPTVVTGYLLSDDLTPPTARTEASTWINTASNAGAAAAAALAGIVVQRSGPTAAFAVSAGFVGACGLLAGASRTLRARTPARAPRPQHPSR